MCMIFCNLWATSISLYSIQLAISHRYMTFVIFFFFSTTHHHSSCFSYKQHLSDAIWHIFLSRWDTNTFSCLPSFSASRTFHQNKPTPTTLSNGISTTRPETSDEGPVIVSIFLSEPSPGEVAGPHPRGRSGAALRLPIPGAVLPPAAG